MNAWNMRGAGWLDEFRVWQGGESAFETDVELRPLHHRELLGWLAADLPGGYVAEFRLKADWDAGIPASAVLIHRFDNGQSYLMPGTSGQPALGKGDVFKAPTVSPTVTVTALEIEDTAKKAIIRVKYQP